MPSFTTNSLGSDVNPYYISRRLRAIRRPSRTSSLAVVAHRGEEVLIGLRLGHSRQQQLHRLDWRERREHLPQHPHAVEIVLRNEQLLFARAALQDIDRRKHAAVGELAIEMDFKVAGPLELLEDDFVHPRARIDERRRDDRQRAALFD